MGIYTMRIEVSSNLKTRAGTPDKDQRLTNANIEQKGESTVVRKRPGVSAALDTGLGLVPQGGIQFGAFLVYIYDDFLWYADSSFTQVGAWNLSTGGFGTYDAGASYAVGDSVLYQDEDGNPQTYYAMSAASNTHPPRSSGIAQYFWSTTAPGTTRWRCYSAGYDQVLRNGYGASRGAAGADLYYQFSARSCANGAPNGPYVIYLTDSYFHIGTDYLSLAAWGTNVSNPTCPGVYGGPVESGTFQLLVA